uniref:DUF5641 domain-containing protein n=1 Tax=Trichuris muris TaxID=70415 RepID=A0A5S6QXD9_TRIMR
MVGTPCYARYCGPKQDKEPLWITALVKKIFGTRTVQLRVVPRGPLWKRHIEQLQPRYRLEEDAYPVPDITRVKGDTSAASCEEDSAATTTEGTTEEQEQQPVGLGDLWAR